MSTQRLPTRPRWLSGRRLAPVLAGAAVVLPVLAVGVTAWSTSQVALADAARAGENTARRLGEMIAAQTDVHLRESDVSSVRRQVLDMRASGLAEGCRVVLAGVGVIASTDPAEISALALPERWDGVVPEGGVGVVRVPFEVPGRGKGYVELSQAPARASVESMVTRAGGVALVTAVMVSFVFVRARKGLSALSAVGSALDTAAGGERRAAVLRVAEDFGPLGDAWNSMLAERDGLDRRLTERVIVERSGAGLADAVGVSAACDVLTHGLVVFDPDERVVYANGAAGVLLGRSRDGLMGAAAEGVFDRPEVRAVISEAAVGKLLARKVVEMSRGEPGKEPDAELRLTVRSAGTGADLHAAVLIEDITQQRLADRSRNAFVAQATHELRTPLTNIRLYVEQALDEGEQDPTLRAQALNVINSEARRLERIVGDMLSVSEIEAGSLKIRPGDVRVDAMFEDLRGDYRAQAEEKSIEMVFDLPPKMPVIHADRDRLGQALHNIVGNALKYTPSGGKVTVRVSTPEDGGLVVDVIDTGIGIDPDECERIFERFYRANDRRIAHVTGSGLGLALAREIIRLHGGEITVHSQINEGSTFTVTLPGREQESPAVGRRAA